MLQAPPDRKAVAAQPLLPAPALGPAPHLRVQLLQVAARGLSHVPHDAVHKLALGKAVLALLLGAEPGGAKTGAASK